MTTNTNNKDMLPQLDAAVGMAAASQMPQMEKSFINVELFNAYVEVGKRMDTPTELSRYVLVKGETTFLFGDAGIGKSTHALQIALDLAEKDETVLYVNFELSQQQLAKKFTDKTIPNKFYIANIDYSLMSDVTDQSLILGEIERRALELKATVLIIDNFTNLCINSKEGKDAGNIMLKLMSLRMTHQWTMLILAHVPKRKPCDPLTLNDLAGSKILSNMADNVVGINRSKIAKNKRYIIQLKYRSLPIILDFKNVLEMTLTEEGGYLHFEYGGFAEERTHLPRNRDEKEELEKEIADELRKPQRKNYREIAEMLGTSPSKVARVAKELSDDSRPNKSK